VGVLYRTPEENLPYAEKFAKHVNCSLDNLNCLLNLTSEDIINAQGPRAYIIEIPVTTKELLPWCPAIDGKIIPDQPITLMQEGKLNKNVTIAFGTNQNETDSFIPDIEVTSLMYKEFVQLIYTNYSEEVLAMYPPNGRQSRSVFTLMTTDYTFTCPTRASARYFQENGAKTFLYQFLYPPPNDPINGSDQCKGQVCHGSELPFVFHSWSFINATANSDEINLSWSIIQYWNDIITNRNLGGSSVSGSGNSKLAAPNPSWPAYNSTINASLDLNVPVSVITNYRSQYCDFWDSIGYIF